MRNYFFTPPLAVKSLVISSDDARLHFHPFPLSPQSNPADVVPGDYARLHFPPLPFPLFPSQIRQMLSLVTTRDYISPSSLTSLPFPLSPQSNPADVVAGDDARLHFHNFTPTSSLPPLPLSNPSDVVPGDDARLHFLSLPSPLFPVKSGRCCPW